MDAYAFALDDEVLEASSPPRIERGASGVAKLHLRSSFGRVLGIGALLQQEGVAAETTMRAPVTGPAPLPAAPAAPPPPRPADVPETETEAAAGHASYLYRDDDFDDVDDEEDEHTPHAAAMVSTAVVSALRASSPTETTAPPLQRPHWRAAGAMTTEQLPPAAVVPPPQPLPPPPL